jgi:hypothetical protein
MLAKHFNIKYSANYFCQIFFLFEYLAFTFRPDTPTKQFCGACLDPQEETDMERPSSLMVSTLLLILPSPVRQSGCIEM